MARAVSVFSSETHHQERHARSHGPAQGRAGSHGAGCLVRNGRQVFIEMNSEDLDDTPDEVVRPVAELLRAWPKSSFVLLYNDSAQTTSKGEWPGRWHSPCPRTWPIVFDDHSTVPELLSIPGDDRRSQH